MDLCPIRSLEITGVVSFEYGHTEFAFLSSSSKEHPGELTVAPFLHTSFRLAVEGQVTIDLKSSLLIPNGPIKNVLKLEGVK